MQREPITSTMDFFSAVSDEMRLKILMLLDLAEFTVNEIKDILDIHQSNASRHLAKLSACGLLKDRRDGIKAYYRLSEELLLSNRVLSVIRDAYGELPDKDILRCRAEQVLGGGGRLDVGQVLQIGIVRREMFGEDGAHQKNQRQRAEDEEARFDGVFPDYLNPDSWTAHPSLTPSRIRGSSAWYKRSVMRLTRT